jgi:dihydrofolate reductase
MIGLIVATAKNNVIGKNNTIPWHNKEDLQFFKKKTTGCNIIMGRKTFESLDNKCLPNRKTFVVSSTLEQPIDNSYIVTTCLPCGITNASVYSDYPDTWVIGGSTIYKEALDNKIPDILLVSRIDIDVDGDTFFPEIPSDYILTDILNVTPILSVYKYKRKACNAILKTL